MPSLPFPRVNNCVIWTQEWPHCFPRFIIIIIHVIRHSLAQQDRTSQQNTSNKLTSSPEAFGDSLFFSHVCECGHPVLLWSHLNICSDRKRKGFSKCVLRRKITLNLFVVVKIKVSYPEERFSESTFSLYDLPNHNNKSLSRIL